jgi:hypothetical protein
MISAVTLVQDLVLEARGECDDASLLHIRLQERPTECIRGDDGTGEAEEEEGGGGGHLSSPRRREVLCDQGEVWEV